MRLLRASLAALLIGLICAPAAFAQGPLELTTEFPSVVSDPGATAKFTLTVATDTPQRVDLSVVSQPAGWTTRIRGGGSTVGAVYTAANPDVPTQISAQVSAEVSIPADVVAGSNQVVIEGRSASGTTARITLDIAIEEQQPGAVTLTADFPNLTGSTSSTFRFNLALKNDTNQQVTFGLESDAPTGWTIDARPSGAEQAATAVVDAGAATTISVTAKPPLDAPAGTYDIRVRAVGGPAPAEAALTVAITGSFAMTLDTTDGRLNARAAAGSPTTLNVIVTNTGSAPLTSVTVSATPPRNWKIDVTPPTITQILPNTSETFQVTITAGNDALAGDYVLTLNAKATEASDSVDIRTTVETSPIGYVIGIAILVLVAVGLFFVFQRYGRR